MSKKSLFLLTILVLYLIMPNYSFAALDSTNVKEKAKVYYVTDGDTVKVRINGKNFVVRLIGVDTPETKDPRKTVQCFGKEASDYTKKILLNQTVILEPDRASGNKDKYGRLLRYVFLADGTNFDRQLIAQGYAHEYTYKSIIYRYQTKFKQSQKDAQKNERGLWADTACAGKNTKF